MSNCNNVTSAAPTQVGCAFRRYWDLGYRGLVPIVPPDAELSPRSAMSKAPSSRGKAVGVRGVDGQWVGFDWVKHESEEEDLPRWSAMKAGVGIKTGAQPDGTTLVLIDADTLDPTSAELIQQTVAERFGNLPVRIGQAPKVGYLVRIAGPVRYARVEFGEVDDRGRLRDRVELLSDGRQFVADGIHPKTFRPYHWPQGVPRFDDIPVFPAEYLP
jgi:hypothetical protein